MKENLIAYVKTYGQKSFRELPFSMVDALAFAELSYLKFDGIVPGFCRRQALGWEDLRNASPAEHMFSDPIFGESFRRLFDLMADSVRYRHVRVHYFKEWIHEEQEVQFAAVTFLIGDTSTFVAYRGTDETLVGWKEDFNMGFMRTVPAQKYALDYLKGVARYTRGRIIVGGHSKGGNLAVYAAACAPQEIQDRIRRVYSFDGPGFRNNFYRKPGFWKIQDRYCKIVPQESLVGVGVAREPQYYVVRSYHVGLLQHDLMNWKIRDGKFVFCKGLKSASKRRAEAVTRWIDSLSRNQISDFVEIMYRLLQVTHARTVYELLKWPLRKFRAIIRAFQTLGKEEQQVVKQVFGKLIQMLLRTKKETVLGGKGTPG